MKEMKRRKKLTTVQKIMLALILLGKNWRALGAIIGWALMVVGAVNLITADVELYVDYSVALKYLAKSWGAIIGGGILTSLCVDCGEVTR